MPNTALRPTKEYASDGNIDTHFYGGLPRPPLLKITVLCIGRRRLCVLPRIDLRPRREHNPCHMSFSCALAFTLACTVTATHQTSAVRGRRTVWDGVYTTAQAERGKAVYEENCRACHGPELSGGKARILRGDSFMKSWAEDDLENLFQKIRSTMPPGHPSSLSDESYLDVIASILQANGLPAGLEALTAGPALASIRIEGKDGPAAVPNYAMVQVFGCLDQGAGDTWTLTHSTEPVRSRNPEASDAATLAAAQQAAPGGYTFGLLNLFPAPDVHRGHRMEVKGLLMRMPEGDRLNVTSLGMVAASCRP